MVSSEASPWAKTGGLADVVGALPEALARIGHAVAVVIPQYQGAKNAPAKPVIEGLRIPLAGRIYETAIRELKAAGATVYFVDQPELFGTRSGLYGDQPAITPITTSGSRCFRKPRSKSRDVCSRRT